MEGCARQWQWRNLQLGADYVILLRKVPCFHKPGGGTKTFSLRQVEYWKVMRLATVWDFLL